MELAKQLPPAAGLGTPIRALLRDYVVPALVGALVAILAHQHLYPPPAATIAERQSGYGPIRLAIRLAGTAPGIAEPLLVCGKPGQAIEVYVRVLPHRLVMVGVDFWGRGKVESEPFQVPSQTASLVVTVSSPAFFPPEGSREWGLYTTPLEARWLRSTMVSVNGVRRLTCDWSYPMPAHSPVFYGRNPIGGSSVSDYFTGAVDSISQRF